MDVEQRWDFTEASMKEQPVTCLGHTFTSDAERRQYFTAILREKLPDLRQIPGFPLGRDEDILALSDPPHYTACPNPFLPEILTEWEQTHSEPLEPYHREPFATDVSQGKNDPIYNAHSYHTKVPHKAIMQYILHYTQPGDVVFDGFAGTGMTGVAAQLCGDRKAVESLDPNLYRVTEDGTILRNEDGQWQSFSRLGARRAILNDLSPAASFIAYNYNTPVDVPAFKLEAERILHEVERECGWMYRTLHHPTPPMLQQALDRLKEPTNDWANDTALSLGTINYTVWSDVFVCPHCAGTLVFWDVAVDKEQGKVADEFACPTCQAKLTKRKVERAWVTHYDEAIGQTVRRAQQVPVLINYSVGKKRHEKVPDAFDWALLDKIEHTPIPYWFPTNRMPEGYNTRQPRESHGITHVHQFFTKRNLTTLSWFWNVRKPEITIDSKASIPFLLSSMMYRASKLNSLHLKYYFFGGGGANAGYLKGTLYIPSISVETSIVEQFNSRFLGISRSIFQRSEKKTSILTGSTNRLSPMSGSVSYIFIDPPFGANIMYSELNFLWEAWLKVFTNNEPEAIVNSVQGKGLWEYQQLMTESFQEAYRILKPGRWMTVEFSNTQASVWNAIQQAIQQAGFVVANVAALDKQQGSFKAVTSTTAVKQDLIISAYKPTEALVQAMEQVGGSEQGVWTFLNAHLEQLPVFLGKSGEALSIVERTPRALYDRLLAYYVRQGWPIPLDSGDFQRDVTQRYPMRDGMVFLAEQVSEYDRKRLTVKTLIQTQFFVQDESSAIDWLRQQLTAKPQTYADLQPAFMKEIQHLSRHELVPGLDQLLSQNFLQYDGKEEPMPDQITGYLRANYPKYRGDTVTPEMREKAKGRWYVPDPRKQADLEKLREKALGREFEAFLDIVKTSRKRLKQCRSEVIRAGFKKLWAERDYDTIILVADHLPEQVITEDLFLSQFVDNARLRVG